MPAGQDLVLDHDIKAWVLIPLSISVILLQLLRQYASVLLMGGKSKEPPKEDELKTKAALTRSNWLRGQSGYITDAAFRQRRVYFTAKDTGVFQQKVNKRDMQEMMMTNPDAMSGMMKQQIGGLAPQLAGGAFVNFFFRGFILGKLPFALSPKFRAMLQGGIDLPALDVTYITSLSYYVLLLFGLRGVMMLLFQDEAVNDAAAMMQMQMQSQMSAMNPAAMDPGKAYKEESNALELTRHQWALSNSENSAAKLLRDKLKGR